MSRVSSSAAYVVGDVLVLLGELVDPALPGPGVLGQLTERDAHLEQLLDLSEQRQRRLRARRRGDVVGDRRPVGDGRYVEPDAGVLEDPDDAGRSFVGRLLQLEPVDEVGLGRGARHRDRAGVRGVGQQRAEGDHELGTQVVAGREDLGTELPPPHVRLDAPHQDDVAIEVGRGGDGDLGARPGDAAVAELVGADGGPVDLEVVELLGVDGPDDAGVPHPDQVVDHCRGSVGGVVPALEGSDDDRLHQLVDLLDLDHPTTVVMQATSPRPRIAPSGSRDLPEPREASGWGIGGLPVPVSRCGNRVHRLGRAS